MSDQSDRATEGLSEHTPCGRDSSQLIYEVARDKLRDQFMLVDILDKKSAIIVALDAGILAFASTWSSADVSKWLVTAGLALLMFGLGASCITVYVRKLWVLPDIGDLWQECKAAEKGQSLDYLMGKLLKALGHNDDVLIKKRRWANWAILLSILGFLLVGLGHIIKIVLH